MGFYTIVDEMLDLFKGTISIDDMKYKYSYRELLTIKKARVDRLRKEQEAYEKSRQSEEQKHNKSVKIPVNNRQKSDGEVISAARAREQILEGLNLL